MEVRVGAGAVAVSTGLLLGALAIPVVAHASPDTQTTADDAPATRGGARAQAQPAPASRGSRGRAADSDVPAVRDRNPAAPAAAVRVPVLPALPTVAPVVVERAPEVPVVAVKSAEAVAPEVASDSAPVAVPIAVRVPVLAPAPLPQPPRLAAAVSPVALGGADALAGGTGAPLPSALAWTMLAAARTEVGRRPAATVVPAAAVTTSAPADPVGQAVSVLGTPQQTAAEAEAMRTVCTLPVLAMKAVIGLAWRIIGGTEYSQVGGPDQANLDALGNAVDEWAMASAFQSMILDSNDPRIVMQVAPPHQWYGLDVGGSRILYDNPDTIYRFAGVNYASQYVITGRLPEGGAKASFSVLTGMTGTTASVLDADTLELGPDRTFVITVSGDPAAPGEKNHLQLTPDTTLIAIRDTLPDWNTDAPMALAIQRVAGPPKSLFGQFGGFAIPGLGPLVAQSEFLTALVSLIPPLPAVPAFIRGGLTSLLMLRGISEESKYIKVATTDPVTGKPKAPNVFTDPTRNASFLATQLQSAGYFQLAADQALVLTITPNQAGYFVAPVTNDWTITDNYWDVQSSLNSAQATPNADGSYTLVVSPAEPVVGGVSVRNWVSTGGLNQGTMAIRFQSLDAENPLLPTVSSQVVALSNLASVLPPGTSFVTPGERAAQLAARKLGFNRRFAPYPQT